jgi:hypothetical protein
MNDERDTTPPESFHITVSDSEVDQDLVNDIRILDEVEENVMELGAVRTEGVAFSLDAIDLGEFFQESETVIEVEEGDLPPKSPEIRCVFCHGLIQDRNCAVACRKRGHPHHQECWRDNGNRCAMHGCDGRQARPLDIKQ